MKLRIFIFGTGAHARKVFNCAIGCGHSISGFVDENPEALSPVPSYPMLPAVSLPAPSGGDAIFVAIGRADVRKRLLDEFTRAGWNCPVLVHPVAWVAPDARLEAGVFVGAGAVVETGAVIGQGAIVDIGVLVDHDCSIGGFSHLKPGSVVGPSTKVQSLLEQT